MRIGFRTHEDTLFKLNKIDSIRGGTVLTTPLRRYDDKNPTKMKILYICLISSLIPIAIFYRYSKEIFTSARPKERLQERRERLDREHNVDRDLQRKSFEQLDQLYRVTEREEMQKLRMAGKNPADYLRAKEAAERGYVDAEEELAQRQ